MAQRVVDAVASEAFGGPAVNAFFVEDVAQQKLAGNLADETFAAVNSSVSLRQIGRPTFVCSTISCIAGSRGLPLFGSHVRPSVGPIVSATLSDPVAGDALIRKPQGARLVFAKVPRQRRENVLASVALPAVVGVGLIDCHSPIIHYGPHFELAEEAFSA